jgi:cyclopropane fatty-acyl-phospholipid synthase-like methyltransferase
MRHRDLVIQGLRLLRPFTRVLEIGCNAGPMLRRIHREWPGLHLAGMDVNREAVNHGLAAARSEGWEWDAYAGDFTAGLRALTEPYDVVVSCYALAYAGPEQIDGVMAEVARLARGGVVLAEPMIRGPSRRLETHPDASVEWAHDVEGLLRGRVEAKTIWTRWTVDPPVDRLDGVLVARRPRA